MWYCLKKHPQSGIVGSFLCHPVFLCEVFSFKQLTISATEDSRDKMSFKIFSINIK